MPTVHLALVCAKSTTVLLYYYNMHAEYYLINKNVKKKKKKLNLCMHLVGLETTTLYSTLSYGERR